MNPSLSDDLERLIDKVFNAVVPHAQYKIIGEAEPVPCQRHVSHVYELPQDYVTPFSSTDYDYKLQAIGAVYGMRRVFDKFIYKVVDLGDAKEITTEVVQVLWACTDGCRHFEQVRGYVPEHMRAFVATYAALGIDEALFYEY